MDIVQDLDTDSGYSLTTHGGTKATGLDALEWITKNQHRGIGELLINSVDADGTKAGFNTALLEAVRSITSLPIVASGGAGKVGDFLPAVKAGANAVLAASVFHNGLLTIGQVKGFLSANAVKVRM